MILAKDGRYGSHCLLCSFAFFALGCQGLRDSEEKELLESYDRDEWQSVPDTKSESDRYRRYAGATYKKDKRVNIRMSEKDLAAIQKKALEEGIPYQTLISSILRKYISGRLTEKSVQHR